MAAADRASGSVTPVTIATAQSGRRVEVDHHFPWEV